MIEIFLSKGKNMEPERIMSHLSKSILSTLKSMEKAKTAEEKLKLSETVKNLTASLDVFFSLMDNLASYDEMGLFNDENDDKPIPF